MLSLEKHSKLWDFHEYIGDKCTDSDIHFLRLIRLSSNSAKKIEIKNINKKCYCSKSLMPIKALKNIVTQIKSFVQRNNHADVNTTRKNSYSTLQINMNDQKPESIWFAIRVHVHHMLASIIKAFTICQLPWSYGFPKACLEWKNFKPSACCKK